MTEIRPVDRDTLSALLALEVAPDQRGLVAPNAVTIAQHAYEPGTEVYGLWSGTDAVGLFAICDLGNPDTILEPGYPSDGIDLWRLMIAATRQRQGHGIAALDFIAGLGRARGRSHVRTSAVPAAGNAIPFYERHGFRRTGEIDGTEIVLRLDL